ncbi:hypothetical protein VCHC42A1_0006, partial [Vibrio cholerae HC-42A1]
MIATAQIIH